MRVFGSGLPLILFEAVVSDVEMYIEKENGATGFYPRQCDGML